MKNNIQKVKDKRRGFQRLNTYWDPYLTCRKPITPYNHLTEEFKKFVCAKGPYDFFISITLSKRMRLNQCCYYINALIYRYNCKMFGRDYKKKGKYINGFAFIEDNKSGISRNDFHMHMLILPNDRYKSFDINEHKDIFCSAAIKILDDRNHKVFNEKCIHLEYNYDGGGVGYAFKEIADKNLTRMKIIGKDGLSDDL